MNKYCKYNEELKMWEAWYRIGSKNMCGYLPVRAKYKWLLKIKIWFDSDLGLTLVEPTEIYKKYWMGWCEERLTRYTME